MTLIARIAALEAARRPPLPCAVEWLPWDEELSEEERNGAQSVYLTGKAPSAEEWAKEARRRHPEWFQSGRSRRGPDVC